MGVSDKPVLRKVYLEITNLCNMDCRFCAGTQRAPGRLNVEQMKILLPKLRPWTDYLYFHLMGEPLGHPDLETFLSMAHKEGFKVIITTNGVLLPRRQETLLQAEGLHKVNVSLHAFEANGREEDPGRNTAFETYLDGCFSFGKALESKGKILVYRLWNEGGEDRRNQQILEVMRSFFPEPWVHERKGIRIGNRVYLEYGQRFDWPDLEAPVREDLTEPGGGETSGAFCYGLRDQVGVLCDGTVVPCCLDHEGDIPLGNLFWQDLGEILSSPRARTLIQGFEQGKCAEELCRRCGYAQRFTRR